MTWQNILAFSGIGAVITVLGNLIALYFKDFIGVRSIETWRAKQSSVATYNKYRKPIALAAKELSGRCYNISVSKNDGPRDKVGLSMFGAKIDRTSSAGAADDHFLRYRFVSDAYRLCCFLGLIELHRREIGLADAGAEDKNLALDRCLQNVKSDLADGHLNRQHDWEKWADALIFREEQRAIGHRMIAPGQPMNLLDFGTFSEILEQDYDGDEAARWFVVAARFFQISERRMIFDR
jgi:hypothetical protein